MKKSSPKKASMDKAPGTSKWGGMSAGATGVGTQSTVVKNLGTKK